MTKKDTPISDALKQVIRQRYPDSARFDVLLSKISRWKIGGVADVIISPRNTEELSDLRAWIHKEGLSSVVIGATSNLLFADEGLRVIAIQIDSAFSSLHMDGPVIRAQPGVWVPGLARKAMLAGLTGIEHTCGIPGTLGGLVCMNGGSQRKGIGEHVTWVDSIDAQGRLVRRNRQECRFAYRQSVFQNVDEVISGIELKLDTAPSKSAARREILSILHDRRGKFPQKLPNCGSVFVSDPAMYEEYGPPGKVIELSGCKGLKFGGATTSDMHANFIINTGNAKASEVLHLINFVRNKVEKTTGYRMRVESKYVDPQGRVTEAGSSEFQENHEN